MSRITSDIVEAWSSNLYKQPKLLKKTSAEHYIMSMVKEVMAQETTSMSMAFHSSLR